MSGRPSPLAAETLHIEPALLAAGFKPLARVIDSDASDLVLALSPASLAVVRCVCRSQGDHTALATMISAGDFIWGALVYEKGEPPPFPGLIETFHVSELDRLVARLVELREAFREAG